MIRIIIVSFFLLLEICKGQIIYDLIEPINLEQDDTTIVLLSDVFFSDDYQVEFKQNKNISFTFDKKTLELTLVPNKEFSGLTLIEFKYFGKDYVIPVQRFKANKYLFTYKASPSDKQINLFGQFNSWNRQNLPMTDEDGDRIFKIEIPLDPGRYEYKFFVDGKELIDPENPVKVPNGLGDFNSVKIIEEPESDKIFLHILGYEKKNENLFLKFYFEHNDKSFKLVKQNVIALLDNQKMLDKDFSINGNEITLKVNSNLQGHRFIRLAVNKGSKVTNIQTIQLIDGKFAGTTDVTTHHDKIIYSLMIDRFSNGDKS
ncbi:MAG: hypothetical protein NZM09_05200, partial [Ignavibacterium sp.]|nr:hypothetical protein [Ignavibacterium sp.]MDW8375073.1 hypothetical protein [Ignavibacteriales bacterium]